MSPAVSYRCVHVTVRGSDWSLRVAFCCFLMLSRMYLLLALRLACLGECACSLADAVNWLEVEKTEDMTEKKVRETKARKRRMRYERIVEAYGMMRPQRLTSGSRR